VFSIKKEAAGFFSAAFVMQRGFLIWKPFLIS